MKLVELDAVLRIYEQNFRNLHWNAVGEDFNDSHKSITTEYYELLSKHVDQIAEMVCMFNMNPCNYTEATDIVLKSEFKYLIVDSNKKYTRKEIIFDAQTMFADLINLTSSCIEELTNPVDAGIKSELETILYEYTLQARYINKRRMYSEA